MHKRADLLKRVQEDADAIGKLASGGLNIPLESYLDKRSLDALCDSLGLEPNQWQVEDLERILIIRDGLYELRNDLRDKGDDAEHSVEQLLSAMDRLYADLERALRELDGSDLKKAQETIAALQRTPHVAAGAVQSTVNSLRSEATELLTQTHVTMRHIEINLIKIDRSVANIETFRNAKLIIQRLSASVFAIKLSLEQSVIFQGVFKFLNDNADKIVGELRDFIRSLQSSYEKIFDFVGDLSKLAERGSRFSHLVGDFLARLFSEPEKPERKNINLRVQNYLQSEAALCGEIGGANRLVLGGKRGQVWNVDPQVLRIVSERRVGHSNVNTMAMVDEDLIAIGTDDGLEVIRAIGQGVVYQATPAERVISVAVTPWGKREGGGLVTGSRDGIVRRWTFAGGLSQVSRESYLKVGRSAQKLVVKGDEVIVAADDCVMFLDADLKASRRIPLNFRVNDVCIFDDKTLLVCGDGNVAFVNIADGIFSRFVTMAKDIVYVCVRKIGPSFICVGSEDGRVCALDSFSGEELGSVRVDFPLRGLIPMQSRILAFGGNWKSRGRSMAFISWAEQTELARSDTP